MFILNFWFFFSGHSQLKPEGDSEFTNGAGDQALPAEPDDVIHKGNISCILMTWN